MYSAIKIAIKKKKYLAHNRFFNNFTKKKTMREDRPLSKPLRY